VGDNGGGWGWGCWDERGKIAPTRVHPPVYNNTIVAGAGDLGKPETVGLKIAQYHILTISLTLHPASSLHEHGPLVSCTAMSKFSFPTNTNTQHTHHKMDPENIHNKDYYIGSENPMSIKSVIFLSSTFSPMASSFEMSMIIALITLS
jgi:hypothetical protein